MPSCSRKDHTSTPSEPSWLCSSIHSPKRTTSYGLRSCVLHVRHRFHIHPLLLEPCYGVVHGNLSALRHVEPVQTARMHLHTSRCHLRPKTAGGVGASLLLSDTRRRRLGLFIWFYLSLKMVCAIVIIEHVADLQGAGPRYPYPKEVWSPSGMFFRFLNE